MNFLAVVTLIFAVAIGLINPKDKSANQLLNLILAPEK